MWIEARYEIIAGDQSFTAIVHGIFDWRRGKGVMNGVILRSVYLVTLCFRKQLEIPGQQ